MSAAGRTGAVICAVRRAGLLLAVLTFAAGRIDAQYLEPEEDGPGQARGITAGVMQREFAPRGSNTEPDSAQIRYSRLMPVIGFRQGPLEVLFGYTTYRLNGRSRSAVFFGTTLRSDIPLAGSPRSGLSVPLLLAADFTKAEAAGPQRENFNIASIGLGGGLRFHQRLERVDWSVTAGAVAHYSFEGLSTGSGFSGAFLGEGVAFFPRAVLLDGLIAGYRFRIQTWSLLEGRFDYRVVTHGVFVGVML